MADNTPIVDAASVTESIATDELATLNGVDVSTASPRIKIQRVKPSFGSDGAAVDVDATHGLPVDVVAALPAGTNVIGHVVVDTLPATPAGTNVIGHVIVDTLPATPAGTNVIGHVIVDSLPATPAGTNVIGHVIVDSLPSIPAGTNVIGHTIVDSVGGTVVVDSELTTADLDTGAGTDTRAVVGLARAESGGAVLVGSANPLPTSVTSAPAASVATDSIAAAPVAETTAAGTTPFRLVSAATTNATSVKASTGKIYTVVVSNVNAAMRYLKFYNKASAPTVGTDTPVFIVPIPGNTAGSGAVVTFPVPIKFTTGIALAITTGIADTDATAVAANEISVSLAYI